MFKGSMSKSQLDRRSTALNECMFCLKSPGVKECKTLINKLFKQCFMVIKMYLLHSDSSSLENQSGLITNLLVLPVTRYIMHDSHCCSLIILN